MEAFNDRWSAMFDDGNEDFDESEPFDNLLEEVELLADATADGNHEGGPGMSSAYVTYYVRTENKAKKALKCFSPRRRARARRSAKIVLFHYESSFMDEVHIEHIELRRGPHANFAVWARKFGEHPITGRRRWFDWHKTKSIKSPMAARKAIKDAAQYLNVDIAWADIMPLIASVDWVTAAVIASNDGYALPALPGADVLLTQRSLRTLGRVTIGAEWGYDMHELSIPFERWVRILGGESWSVDEPYWYEGARFTGTWSFDKGGLLDVSYEDGGEGWSGKLGDLELIDGPKVDGTDLAKIALSAAPGLR